MQAILVEKLGQTPKLGEFHQPVPLKDEVLVKVLAASIKQLDRAIVKGVHYSSPHAEDLPIIAGTDGVGLLADNSRVYFTAFRQPYGAMANYSVASLTVPVPDNVSNDLAAALVNPALAAWLPLQWRAKLQPGETVLILGATGTSGKLAITAAREMGAKYIIAAGRRQAVLDSLDVDKTINLSLNDADLKQTFSQVMADMGIDVIVDYVWGHATEVLLDTLVNKNLHMTSSYGIRLVNVGSMGGADITLPAGVLRSSTLQIMGSGTGNFPPGEQLQQIIKQILALASKGSLNLDIISYPITEIEKA